MGRSPITTPGPLNVSATITAGTTYPAVTIKAPLGPKFQGITEWTGDTAVNLSTFAGSVHTRTGPNGTMIYGPELDAAKIAKIDTYLGVTIAYTLDADGENILDSDNEVIYEDA